MISYKLGGFSYVLDKNVLKKVLYAIQDQLQGVLEIHSLNLY